MENPEGSDPAKCSAVFESELAYLQEHVNPTVLNSMRSWDRKGNGTPAPLDDEGMQWLQKLLVYLDCYLD